MVLGMAFPVRDTTQSTTGDARLAENDSETGHGRSVGNSTGSSTRESNSTAHNALALRMIVDQLIRLLAKDNKEVKSLQAMLDAATMVDPTLDRGDGRWGQDPKHRQSPRRDSANIITPPKERGQDRDNRDLRDVIRNRDARDRIENRRQERDRIEHE
jgi:hypothetical protein